MLVRRSRIMREIPARCVSSARTPNYQLQKTQQITLGKGRAKREVHGIGNIGTAWVAATGVAPVAAS